MLLKEAFGSPSGAGRSLATISKKCLDADSLFGGNRNSRIRIEAEILFDLISDTFDIGRRQVDFIDDGNDFQIAFHCEIEIGQRLGLDSLTGVDQQQGAFTGSQRTGHFVAKIDMAGRVDQIEGVCLTVPGRYTGGRRSGFLW